VALLLGGALLAGGCHRKEGPRPGPTPVAQGPTEKATVSLLYPGRDGLLHEVRRDLPVPLSADGRVQAVVTALLAGPEEEGLVAPLPGEVTVGDVFVDAQGVAYVDLAAKDQPTPPASGSDLELLRVYSLVDTVIANEPRVRSVVLLWNGVQRPTFAGHVDTMLPLLEDKRWVR
jgi:hypothetical protein